MVRKRRRQEEEVKPWCFYCDREFNDEATLITHQKSKHFKCETCHKRLVTIKALAVHSLQVHKHPVAAVPDALPGRDSMEFDIFGMTGIPAGMVRGGEVPKPGSEQPAPSAGAPPLPGQAYAPPTLPPPGHAPYPPQQYTGYGYPPTGQYSAGPPQHGAYPVRPPMPPPGPYARPPYGAAPPAPSAPRAPYPPAGSVPSAPAAPNPEPATASFQPGAVLAAAPVINTQQQQQPANTGGPLWKEEGVSPEERRACLPQHLKHAVGIVLKQQIAGQGANGQMPPAVRPPGAPPVRPPYPPPVAGAWPQPPRPYAPYPGYPPTPGYGYRPPQPYPAQPYGHHPNYRPY